MNAVRFICLMLCLSAFNVMAGSTGGGTNPQLDPLELAQFSKKVERTAAKHGARVFLLSRMGRAKEELPKGISYTHTGVAVYSMIETDDGKTVPGYAVYNLYQKDDDPSKSHLVTDFPVDFFAGAFELKAGIAIPTPEVQQRILQLIGNGNYKKYHNPEYSVLSNPFNARYQNCNEYLLDLINGAIYQSDDIAQLKANAKAYFEPQPIAKSSFKLALAALAMEDLTLRDHKGKVKTTTYTTIVSYLKDNNLLAHEFTLEN